MENIQKTLALLYTNATIRDAFLENPKTALRELGLSEKEIAIVASISAEELTYFSNSLLKKRFYHIQKLLPLTSKILKKDSFALFQLFAKSYTPTGIHKHIDDAIFFASFLIRKEQNIVNKKIFLYEKTNLIFWNKVSYFFCIQIYFFPLKDLVNHLENTHNKKTVCISIWLRFSKSFYHKIFCIL